MNILGVEDAVNLMSMTDGKRYWQEHPASFLDFTIDGTSLRELFDRPDYLTLLTANDFDSSTRLESLQRLLGVDIPPPSFTPRFHRTRLDRWLRRRGTPYAPWGTAFEDGRVGLLFCRCGDLDCGTLSTRLEFHRDSVVWRDIGWQTTYERFAGVDTDDALTTAEFSRGSYERLIRGLLETDWSIGHPNLS